MSFLNTMIIPDHMSRMEVYWVLKDAAEGSRKGSRKGSIRAVEKRPVIYKLSQETMKKSYTLAVATKKHWQEFVKEQGIKRTLELAYFSMALETFMDMVEGGEVDISLK